jgi:hypothetical protein
MIVPLNLESTFCAQPMGDTVSRKGIIDAIVFGCIPVVFVPHQLYLWTALWTAEEFKSFSVMVPESYMIGSDNERISLYSNFVGQHAWAGTMPTEVILPHSLEAVLDGISEAEVRRKQAMLVKLSARAILSTEDSSDDSLHTMLARAVADAAATTASWCQDPRANGAMSCR